MSAKLPPCPARTPFSPSCKKRSCEVCGVRWARNWFQAMKANLAAYGGPVVLVSITAPGQDRLPWDLDHCAHRRPHECSGPFGCRVQQRAAREWADTATWRWAKMRQAARLATVRACGRPPALLERVWEPQKRGVPHLHLVLGYGSPAAQEAAHVFVAELARLAESYDFGLVDRKLKPRSAETAAQYLSSYLTGRNGKKKNTIRDNIANPIMPRSLIWLTPKLTRITLVTMRTLRRARHLWGAADGICSPPKWAGMVEVVRVAACFRRVYRRAGPLEDEDAWLAFAERVDAEREREVRRDWRKRYDPRHAAELDRFAYMLAGVTPKWEPVAAAA